MHRKECYERMHQIGVRLQAPQQLHSYRELFHVVQVPSSLKEARNKYETMKIKINCQQLATFIKEVWNCISILNMDALY